MSSTIAEHNTFTEYRIIIVEQIEPPTGMLGAWYRYVIQRGKSKIEGLHAGDLNAVTEHVETYVESLNERLTKRIYAYGSQRKK